MLCDDDEEDAEVLKNVAQATKRLADLRKHIMVLSNPSADYSDRFQALMWQVFIVDEMDTLLTTIEMRLTGAAVH